MEAKLLGQTLIFFFFQQHVGQTCPYVLCKTECCLKGAGHTFCFYSSLLFNGVMSLFVFFIVWHKFSPCY